MADCRSCTCQLSLVSGKWLPKANSIPPLFAMIALATDADSDSPEPVGQDRFRRLFVLFLVGLLIGTAAALFALRILNRDPTPTLTPEIFHAAHERWKKVAPPDYDIEVRVTGSQPATYRVE